MSRLIAPEKCSDCGRTFADGDKIVFSRKATVVKDSKRKWSREERRHISISYLGVQTSSSQIRNAHHEKCQARPYYDVAAEFGEHGEMSEFEPVISERILEDGRKIVVYRRMYNTLLTISNPGPMQHLVWDHGY